MFKRKNREAFYYEVVRPHSSNPQNEGAPERAECTPSTASNAVLEVARALTRTHGDLAEIEIDRRAIERKYAGAGAAFRSKVSQAARLLKPG
jgi:hypothetical protein